jgi:hypothetical protein
MGWTVPLRWTHPTSYGSAAEAARLVSLLWWAFPSAGVFAIGKAIRIYKLGEDVWNRRGI